jgi:DNA-binding IclR family transcriptional regulator
LNFPFVYFEIGAKALKEKLAKKNQSVEKVFQIIEVMAKAKGPMRLQDISVRIGLPASTALRYLNTLMTFGYVNQDVDSQKYSLTLKFAQIGSLVSSQISIREIARPYLIDLSEKCQESTCLAIEDHMEAIYIDVVDGPDNMLKTLQRIGKSAPLHSTGVGKLFLLNYPIEKIDMLIAEKGLSRLTENTISTKEELMKELDRVKCSNYAFDNEECEIGAKCIAAPIRDYTGKIVAGISVSGPVTRMTPEKIKLLTEYTIVAAQKISEILAYDK